MANLKSIGLSKLLIMISLTAVLITLCACSSPVPSSSVKPSTPTKAPIQESIPSQNGATSWNQAPLPTISPSSPQYVTATMDDANSLIFHIRGSVTAPGKVVVEYWSEGTGPFVTVPVSTTGTNFSVEVMQLRALTQYDFQVFLETSSNTPALQSQGTFVTGPLPPGLQNAKIQLTQGTPTYGLLLLDYNCTNFNGIVAIDREGQIVWYYQNDNQVFAVSPESDHNMVFNEISQNIGYTMKEIAPDGTVLHSVDDVLENGALCAPHGRWNHEMLVRPDNKVWTIGAEIQPVIINGKYTLQTGGTIEEWNMTTGTVTQLVSLFDLLDPVTDRRVDSNTTGGFYWTGSQNQYAGIAEDWTHANSLDVMPNGDILMSLRHLDQIIAIKPDFSGIDWKLGGVGSNFTFPNPSDQFYHQHYVRMLPNGDILLFDNGNLRPTDQGGQYSRALELKLNFSTMQATKVWEYRSTPDLFSSAVGSVIRLANGNTVVDFGVDPNNDNPPIFKVVEADPAGNAVATTTISSPGKGDQYRAIPINSLNGETSGAVLSGG